MPAERDFIKAARERVVVFDGGMGATLEQFDLTSEDYGGLPGKCHEALVLNRPDVIQGVHESMIAAGAQVLETDTFQASRLKLEEWGLDEHTLEINRRAAEIARAAAGEQNFVAGSIGPTGHLPASDDPTLGKIRFRELADVFAEQARGLVEGGADLIIVETAQDILEVKAAIFGAREAFKLTGRRLPIQASVSLLPNGGKMLLGTDIQAVLTTLVSLDVDVIGLNCSTGPEDMRDAIRYLGENSPVPVHCIPNAGLPLQGPDGETIFPEKPDPLANSLQEFVERYGISIVGGCCGTTPDHIAAIVDRVGGREAAPRPETRSALVSSMMTATPLVQEPRPTLVGERVNSQGSRKAKELLLADDYDGIMRVAEDQVEGGAHVLDVCVALTERQDEDEQMREVVKRISLTQPAPIQVDSTEPDVIQSALEAIPGRAIVNSVNLEAGRDKLDVVAPLAKSHGAALIALTIDEVGMAKTAERKLEVAQRIVGLACDEHGLDREALIFDALTFTLTTGDEEWRPSAVETIEGIRRIKAELPGVKTSLGVSNVSFGVSPGARAVLNSVFLHHCVEAGLDLAIVNPTHITPYGEISEEERELADDLVLNRREDALERFIAHFEQKGEAEEDTSAGDPTEGMEPEEALHFHILHRKKEGVEDWIDRSVEKIGAVPTLNQVLLPAMKEVGDKFGAGELILPFVLQSAEVMKKAVAQLENYLEKIEGHTKGRVVIATVFGDVHDIGKSLVNTILTNNGYTVIDLGKQVPVDTIINAADRARRRRHRAVGAAGVDLQADADLRAGAARARARVPGAGRRRGDQPRLRAAHSLSARQGVRRGLRAGRLLLQGRLRRAGHGGPAGGLRGARRAGGQGPRGGAQAARAGREARRRPARDRLLGALRREYRQPRAHAALLGRARDRGGPRRRLPLPRPSRAVQAALGRARREGRGVGEARGDDFQPRLERMWAEQDYLRPRTKLGYFPCAADGNELVVFDPSDPSRELERLSFPRQPKHDRICLTDFFRPLDSAERDVVALQGVTVGPEVTELMAKLERDGEFAEQLFTHGIGVQSAEGLAEWLHSEASARAWASSSTRAGATPGAIPPARTSPSTRRCGACWGSRTSGCRSRTATR